MKNNEDRKAYYKERRKLLKAEHRCVSCAKPLPDGYTLCECAECKEKSRISKQKYNSSSNVKQLRAKQDKEKYEFRKLHHLCTACGSDLPLNYNKLTCENCCLKSNIRHKKRYQIIREKVLARQKEYHARPEIKEHNKEYHKKYYLKNLEMIKAKHKKYQLTYIPSEQAKQNRKKYLHEYYIKNKEKFRLYKQEYYKKQKEQKLLEKNLNSDI